MMICNDCKKEIDLCDLGRMIRRGHNIHEHIEDYFCPHCGEDVYPTESDWEKMVDKDWFQSKQGAQYLSDMELRHSLERDE